MNSLIKILKEAGVDSACREIGINFDKIFQTNLSINPYQEHKWYVNNHSKVVVFSAVPVEDKHDRLFWEEWFRMRDEDVSYHHILTLWRPKMMIFILRKLSPKNGTLLTTPICHHGY